jgi:dihydroorotate dehydrogenase electron transfer subunit
VPEVKTMSQVTSHKSQAVQTRAKVLQNREIAPGFFKLRIAAAQIAKIVRPGQFLNIKVNSTYEPLLRKPLSISRIKSSPKTRTQVELLYKVVGKGTKILSQRKKGSFLDILGPLGNGFDIPSSLVFRPSSILVGGGIGVAPLLFLAERLVSHQVTRSPGHQIIVLLGAKTKKEILCEKEFRELGGQVKIATDDGSRGFKGSVSDLLKMILRRTKDEACLPARQGRRTVYACGPKPMLKAIACLGKKFDLTCYGLLEEYMACGTGICFGCVVKTKTGYQRVCEEGPVFDLSLIQW